MWMPNLDPLSFGHTHLANPQLSQTSVLAFKQLLGKSHNREYWFCINSWLLCSNKPLIQPGNTGKCLWWSQSPTVMISSLWRFFSLALAANELVSVSQPLSLKGKIEAIKWKSPHRTQIHLRLLPSHPLFPLIVKQAFSSFLLWLDLIAWSLDSIPSPFLEKLLLVVVSYLSYIFNLFLLIGSSP